MSMIDFITQLKTLLPEDAWSWVLAALRQDDLIWESLKRESLQQQFIEHAADQPRRWSPALLAILVTKNPH